MFSGNKVDQFLCFMKRNCMFQNAFKLTYCSEDIKCVKKFNKEPIIKMGMPCSIHFYLHKISSLLKHDMQTPKTLCKNNNILKGCQKYVLLNKHCLCIVGKQLGIKYDKCRKWCWRRIGLRYKTIKNNEHTECHKRDSSIY